MRDLVLMLESEATYKAMNAKKQLRESIAMQIQETHMKYQIHFIKKFD